MDHTKLLDSYGNIIESDLKEQFAGLIERGKSYHPFIADTYEAVEEFVLRGGRRLSACSTLMVYKGYTNKIDQRIVKISSGIDHGRRG